MRTLVGWIKTFITMQRAFLIGALLASASGCVLYVVADNAMENEGRQRFDRVVRTAHFTLLSRVKSYTDLLRGSASMFQATPGLTRQQFHRYVEGLNLRTEFPGVEAINYGVRVSDAERPRFERDMQAELESNGGTGTFRIMPPGRREEYLVLTFVEPGAAWSSRIGLDLKGRKESVAPLDKSRDAGTLAASGRPIPMRAAITGLGMRLPVYAPGKPISTVAERRAAYLGSIGLGFSVERLMEGVLAELPAQGMRMTLAGVVDDGIGGPLHRIMLYDSSKVPGGAPAAANPDDEFDVALPIEFSERKWEVRFRIHKRAMQSGLDAYIPLLAMAAGGISTGLLYALFYTLSSSRRRALRLAEEMTKELRASEANLQMSNAKLRELAAHAENIKEGERKRIAREIHDDLGQNLLALRIEADLLASRTGARHPLLHQRAQRTLGQIDTTIKSVRQIINDLRPNVLDLGLNAAVDWQIADFERRTGISCELIENEKDIKVNDRYATALFRILQESLTNISRHAKATKVRVELLIDTEHIWMQVSDNGVGLHSGGRHKPGSFGLVGIEERVKILNGKFAIGSGPNGGTVVSVSVPLTEDVAPSSSASVPNPIVPDKTESAFV
jgi:signal transduction histidine kinase